MIFNNLLLQAENWDPDLPREFSSDLTEIASEHSFLNLEWFNWESFVTLFIFFNINLFFCGIIAFCFYYLKSKRKDYFFTFMLFSVTVFLLMFLLNNVNLGMGFALGLFAIFGMIRYRTEMVPIREMTYLFIIIGVAVINGLSMANAVINLLIVNLFIVGIIAFVEGICLAMKKKPAKIILYDKIELVKHGREAELKADLEERTGLKIKKMEVGHIDFLRDVAYIKIHYEPIYPYENTIDLIVKPKEFVK